MPFYAWECITLDLGYREVDLVIRDEAQMKALLMFLIYSMKTVDGKQGSAIPIHKALFQQYCQEEQQ